MHTEFPRSESVGAVGGVVDLPVELLSLVGTLPLTTLRDAAHRAEAVGVGGDEALVAAGAINRETYTDRLADWLGVPSTDLSEVPSDAPRPTREALAAGFLPIGRVAGRPLYAVVPRGRAIAPLIELIRRQPAVAQRLRLVSPERLDAYVARRLERQLGEFAAFDLLRRAPEFSAARRRRRGFLAMALGLAALASAFALAPLEAAITSQLLLSVGFLAWIALRMLALLPADVRRRPPRALRDDELPVYSVVVPLYREAHMVRPLLQALDALDYPREKLDVLLVVEHDDRATRSAIVRAAPPPHVRTVVAPPIGPRTKPKALNAALPFAHGELLVIYDAEDMPEPQQLKRAAGAFAAGDPRLACVQAQLAIDNARDGWLTRHFATEYAGLFDMLLPLLVANRLPIPLGGTSNHFRVRVLRQIGGWDAFNVTEDADLGLRLARFGWRTGLVASTTWEEAPRHFRGWLKQRTRWFKGWMQTWLVHMRRPRRLIAELGVAGFLSLQLMIGGTVLSALVHPLFAAILLAQAAGAMAFAEGTESVLVGLSIATLSSGYLGTAALGLAGLMGRRLTSISWVLLTQPIYWLLLSLAAWRALVQLLFDPFRWEKTEHGMGRTSVRTAPAAPAKPLRPAPRRAPA